MVQIKEVSAKPILDSRGERTIEVHIKTNIGKFSASAPNGKSVGRNAVKIYKMGLGGDIDTLKKFSDYFSNEIIESFDDLRRIEDTIKDHVGANSLVALECALLKALAEKKKKAIWQIINEKAMKFPRLVGNCIGGGVHSKTTPLPKGITTKNSDLSLSSGLGGKKPDFQEFLLIPNLKSVKENFEKNKMIKEYTESSLRKSDKDFNRERNDENAWMTSLDDKKVLDVLKNFKVPLGIDVAASGFFKRKMYSYKNPLLKRTSEEQLNYIINLIDNFNLYYIEDPFNEEDFESFSKLVKKFPDRLIVGDDLIVTSYKRLKKAIEMKSVNAIIVKPNQCGSLIEVKDVCELAKENNIKLVFSHRSGETDETILADLAFGFGADFFKCGIDGKEREVKLKRLMDIERGFR